VGVEVHHDLGVDQNYRAYMSGRVERSLHANASSCGWLLKSAIEQAVEKCSGARRAKSYRMRRITTRPRSQNSV